jgi:hypothetical protein
MATTPPDRGGDSRRIVAAGKLGPDAGRGPWVNSSTEHNAVRISGTLKYDRDAMHKNMPYGDPTMDGAYPNPVVKADYIDHMDKKTGESRGSTVLADPWANSALVAKAGRKRQGKRKDKNG